MAPPTVLTFWVPKGGVGKSSRCLETATMLSDMGSRVIVVEFDSQKDIAKRVFRRKDVREQHDIPIEAPPGGEEDDDADDDGLSLSLPGFTAFYARSARRRPNNIYDTLKPVIEMMQDGMYVPDLIAVQPPTSPTSSALWLLPGHPLMQEFDTQVTLAYSSKKINQSILTAFNKMVGKLYDKYHADFILVDLDPSRGEGNGHIICSSDGLVMPCEADGSSYEALRDGLQWLRRFKAAYEGKIEEQRRTSDEGQSGSSGACMPPCRVKLLGTMQSKFLKKDGVTSTYIPAKHAFWLRKQDQHLAQELPGLQQRGLAFTNEQYIAAGISPQALCLMRMPNFASLNGDADKAGVNVPFLTADDIFDRKGKPMKGGPLQSILSRVQDFRGIVENCVTRMLKLYGQAADRETALEQPLPDHRTAPDPGQQKKRLRNDE